MFKNLFKNYIYPVAVFLGGMVGVGFLALPYIAMQAGIWLMLLYFLIITVLIIVIDLIFSKISLKTPDFKRFPGFVDYHLGKWGWAFAMVSTILGLFGVLLVYLIVGGQFLTAVFQPLFSGNILTYTLVYFFVASIIMYFDIKVISRTEFWVIALLFVSFLCIFIGGFSQIKLSNIFISNFKLQISNFFLPYGALLFSLWGVGLIPEIEEMLIGKKKSLKKVVIISTVMASFFYLLFVFLILGITGKQTTQTALAGLKTFLPNLLVSVALLFGVLATFAAFITQGIILKKTLMFDLKIKRNHAFIMTCFTPLILLLLGLNFFIPLISLIGGVFLGINGILILLMYKKIGGKNIIIYPLSLVFLLGLVYEIIYFIK